MNKLKTLVIALPLMSTSLVHAASTNQLYAAIDGGVFQANFNTHYWDQTGLIPQNISNSALQDGYIASPEKFSSWPE